MIKITIRSLSPEGEGVLKKCLTSVPVYFSKVLYIVSFFASYSSNTSLCDPVRAATRISCA